MKKPFHAMTARQQREFYKTWIRTHACRWCGSVDRVGSYQIHASHHNQSTQGPSGTGRKASDFNTLPLCFRCHVAYHGTGILCELESESASTDATRDFLQRAIIDFHVEFFETILCPEVF